MEKINDYISRLNIVGRLLVVTKEPNQITTMKTKQNKKGQKMNIGHIN